MGQISTEFNNLANVAPKDIKSTNNVPLGLVQYLTCAHPITFSLSFMLRRKEALLRAYLRVEEMADFLPDACEMLASWRDNSPASEHFDQAIKRFRIFEQDLRRRHVNENLARQIHLTAAAIAVAFYLVTKSTAAGFLRWISDRDALIERYDTVVYDLAHFYFVLLQSKYSRQAPNSAGRLLLDMPDIQFELPEKTGKHRFDEMVRLPDYLAGTLADLDPDAITFSKAKFNTVLQTVFVNAPNNWVIELLSDAEKITARSAQFRD